MGGEKIAVAERVFDLESTLIINLFTFSGVGRESEPVFRRNESWLAGSRFGSAPCSCFQLGDTKELVLNCELA